LIPTLRLFNEQINHLQNIAFPASVLIAKNAYLLIALDVDIERISVPFDKQISSIDSDFE
jgi:hypothetical protein